MKPLKPNSQNFLIWKKLLRSSWVGMPDLAKLSGSLNVHSRIAELRKRGWNIINRTKRLPDGRIASEYRLKGKSE